MRLLLLIFTSVESLMWECRIAIQVISYAYRNSQRKHDYLYTYGFMNLWTAVKPKTKLRNTSEFYHFSNIAFKRAQYLYLMHKIRSVFVLVNTTNLSTTKLHTLQFRFLRCVGQFSFTTIHEYSSAPSNL